MELGALRYCHRSTEPGLFTKKDEPRHLADFLDWVDTDEHLETPRQLEHLRQSNREERAAQRQISKDLQVVPLKCSAEN